MRCTSLKPDDLVLVHVKAPSGYHRNTDQWEDKQYQVLSQLGDQPVFRVQPVGAITDEKIKSFAWEYVISYTDNYRQRFNNNNY